MLRANAALSGVVLDLPHVMPGARAALDAVMDLNMRVMLPGRERTLSEYRDLFERAGLRFVRLIETHSPFQILEATR